MSEKDRGVEAEASNGLQRRLDRKRGRIAEVEEGGRGGANLAIFRQVAAGLPHQPDWRDGLALARQRSKQRFLGLGHRL